MTDASNTGIAGWVGQKINDVIRPAGFHSRKLNPGQVNYTTTDKELLAIVDSLRHFQDQLQGHKITIRTDHQALVSFMKNIQTNQMKRRWQEFMSQFDITLEHIKGEDNAIADLLSRAYKPQDPPPTQLPPHSPSDHSVLPPVVTNHLHIRYPHIYNNLPPTYNSTMPAQRFSHITGRTVTPRTAQWRRLPPLNTNLPPTPRRLPQAAITTTPLSPLTRELDEIFHRERYEEDWDSPENSETDNKERQVRLDRIQQRMGIVHPQEQQAVQTAATTTRAQAQQQQVEQPQELRRSVKRKPKIIFGMEIN